MAALSLAIWAPTVLSAQSDTPATQWVGASAGLITTLNAKDAHAGQQFEARLPHKVRLKDGTELPGGTLLIGKIGTDDVNVQGRSKLVLLIDEARLKDGKTVPVKATVVSIYRPGPEGGEYYMSNGMDPAAPNPWHNGVTKIEQLDALHNVDLHSNLNSSNSGVLVSKAGDNIKLKSGTEFALVIAADNSQQSQNSTMQGGR
jgi:hypothetical protein